MLRTLCAMRNNREAAKEEGGGRSLYSCSAGYHTKTLKKGKILKTVWDISASLNSPAPTSSERMSSLVCGVNINLLLILGC